MYAWGWGFNCSLGKAGKAGRYGGRWRKLMYENSEEGKETRKGKSPKRKRDQNTCRSFTWIMIYDQVSNNKTS